MEFWHFARNIMPNFNRDRADDDKIRTRRARIEAHLLARVTVLHAENNNPAGVVAYFMDKQYETGSFARWPFGIEGIHELPTDAEIERHYAVGVGIAFDATQLPIRKWGSKMIRHYDLGEHQVEARSALRPFGTLGDA